MERLTARKGEKRNESWFECHAVVEEENNKIYARLAELEDELEDETLVEVKPILLDNALKDSLDELEQKRQEIKALKAENAELKARLEKAVELKYHKGDYVYFISWLSGNVCEGEIIGWQEDSGYAIQTEDALISAYQCFDTREAAEARLKRIKR